MQAPGFWDDQEHATAVSAQHASASRRLESFRSLERDVDDLEQPVHIETRHVDEKDQIGRNDPCWCGSGKKFKKCHGA